MRSLRFTLPSSITLVSLVAGCGAAPPPATAVPATATEVSLEAVEVHRSDTTAPAPSAPPEEALASAALRALDARHADVARCYEQALHNASDVVGRLAVEITFDAHGAVEYVGARTEGEGGIGNARVCVENALRGVRLAGVPAQGARVRRSYSFVNPPLELAVGTPLEVSPPHHHGGGHRSSTAPVQPPAAPSPGAPDASARAVLAEADVVGTVGEHLADLQACYAVVLHNAHGAAGNATLDLTVQGDGTVERAQFEGAQAPLDSMADCIAEVARPLHFRATGSPAHVRYPLSFTRR